VAINVGCSCGKQLRLKEELAGRKVRCPGCQAVVLVPAPAAPTAAEETDSLESAKPRARGPKPHDTVDAGPAARKMRPAPAATTHSYGALWVLVGGVVLFVLLGGAVAAVLWSGVLNRDQGTAGRNDTPRTDTGKPLGDTSKGPGDGTIALTLEELGKEWNANPDAANAKYHGKTLLITGKIGKFSIGVGHQPHVLMPTGGEQDKVLHIETRDKEPWAKAAPGQVVKVRGKMAYGAQWPTLEAAEFVDPPASDARQLQADALSADAAKDHAGTVALLKDKALIVTGEVASAPDEWNRLLLKGPGGKLIECRTVGGFKGPPGQSPSPGQQVRLFGFVDTRPPFREGVVIELRDCLPIMGAK
jgi:hypothetical protein